MPQNPFSADGYIINQDKTAHIPYGGQTSAYSGCGWIAAYNFLRAMGAGQNLDPAALSRALATGWFKGSAGTGPFRLKRYLEGRGYRFATACTKKGAAALAPNAKAGILLYVEARHGLHFVTFLAHNGAEKRFLNAEYGAEAHYTTVAAFAKKYVKTPFCYLMVPL